ncbi:MAG: hypothetical protein H6656_20095 [Ardenticatenaceae bacterium]|nr:hypothetical protein [Ardenticatenaceae bacterium]
MPAEVGAGTFWSGMVDWVGGEDTETVFANIEASWPDAETGLGGTGDAEEEEAAEETGGYEHLAAAEAGEYDGTTVTIFGKWTEGEGESFVNTLADFAERTGIDIQYEGSSEFETLITVRVEGGDAPTSLASRSRACWPSSCATAPWLIWVPTSTLNSLPQITATPGSIWARWTDSFLASSSRQHQEHRLVPGAGVCRRWLRNPRNLG